MQTLIRKNQKVWIDPRKVLMDAVVRVTAAGGIESVSVRTLVAQAQGVSTDVYIYRLFGSKENLLRETFLREDAGLAHEVERRTQVLWENNLPFEDRMRHLWSAVWHYLTDSHAEACLFLTRYYYCSFCDDDTLREHRALWYPLSVKWQDVFPMADTAQLAEFFFSCVLTAAFPVCLGRAPNDGTVAENGLQTLLGIFQTCDLQRRQPKE